MWTRQANRFKCWIRENFILASSRSISTRLKDNILSIYLRVSQPFWPTTSTSRYWGLGDPQGLIFTMIMIIILWFGLLLVVFYDDFPFPYWKEKYFDSYICLGDPPGGWVGIPWSIPTAMASQQRVLKNCSNLDGDLLLYYGAPTADLKPLN